MAENHSRMRAIISWIAAMGAVVVAVSPPVGYFALSYQSADSEMITEAEVNAVLVNQLIAANPAQWRSEKLALAELVEEDKTHTELPEVRRIMDASGQVLAQSEGSLAAPVLTRSKELTGPGKVTGRVEISRSLAPLLQKTAWIALLGLGLGVAVFTALRILPLRALDQSLTALRREKDKAEVTLASIGDAVITADGEGRIDYMNGIAEQLTGWHQAEARGRMIQEVVNFQADRLRCSILAAPETQEGGTTVKRSHGALTSRDQHSYATEYTTSLMHDESGAMIGTVLVLRDITERRRAEERLAYLANYDSLTGLPNRSLFHDRLNQAMSRAQRNEQLLALLFLDLDCFKAVNDSLGHAIGDRLLQSVAERLRGAVRRSDTVSRYDNGLLPAEEATVSRLGGDEFTIILEDISSAGNAAVVAQKILDTLAAPFTLAGHEIAISASIGIAFYPLDGTDPDDLLKHADIAMYRAKERGRNGYQIYA